MKKSTAYRDKPLCLGGALLKKDLSYKTMQMGLQWHQSIQLCLGINYSNQNEIRKFLFDTHTIILFKNELIERLEKLESYLTYKYVQ